MNKKYLLICALFSAATESGAAQTDDTLPLRDKNDEPIQAGVYTSRWGRLFLVMIKHFLVP